MNPHVILGAVLLAVALCAGSAKLGYDHAKGQAAREELLIQKAGAAASASAAKAISGIEMKTYPIRERVEQIIRETPATPPECDAPQAIVDEINKARAAP